jgi:hypothetical protein
MSADTPSSNDPPDPPQARAPISGEPTSPQFERGHVVLEPIGIPAAAPVHEAVAPGNCRPTEVTTLMIGGVPHPNWYIANRRANRFFLVNLETVLGRLNLDHTKTQAYFESAEQVIKQETGWQAQHPFDYEASHTHIYPLRRREAKLFGHAVTTVVAMEMAAVHKKSDVNIYDYLRILPAHFFVDRFDGDKLAALAAFHQAMPRDEKIQRFGEEAADASFEQVCLTHIDQQHSDRLLDQMASGYCITKYTADRFVTFIAQHYPATLHVGKVLGAGDEQAISNRLGTKNAAPSLRVPKTLPQAELPPCA